MARFHPKLAPSRPSLPDDALEEEMAAMPYNTAAPDRFPAICRRTFYLTHIDENQDLNNGH